MKKIQYILLFLTLQSLLFVSCTQDDEWKMTQEQRDLIGTAVNFEPYVSNFEVGTRVGEPVAVTNGGFNRGDMMYIYRQYLGSDGKWTYGDGAPVLPGTIYKYTEQYNGETGIYVKSSWKPFENKRFSMKDGDFNYTMPNLITKADSIIWENGSTVRFRCWTLSSLCGGLGGESYNVTYPDYMVCDWVTVSGPTEQIPMAMHHLGCRFVFSPYGGNSFVNSDNFRIQITYDPADYMREDNADTDVEDAADKAESLEKATELANNVKAVYEKMCFPAGVDMNDMSLLACKETRTSLTSNEAREKAPYTTTYQHGKVDAETIASYARRPEFIGYYGSSNYMISIPYDMSSEHDGELITLPPYTRFRVYLRDVNNGDRGGSAGSGAESDYHIFVLGDVKKRDGNGNTLAEKAFPDGITLKPGYSFQFYVGYVYDQVKVTAADNFSWTKQDLANAEAENKVKEPEVLEVKYKWWHDGIDEAIKRTQTSSDNYNPEFHIKTVEEYLELIDLVNGNFTYNDEVKKGYRTNPETKKRDLVAWYTDIVKDENGVPDTIWISREDAEAEGYVFYNHYHPKDATNSAYAEEDILRAPYNFFETDVQRRFTVYIDNDLDFNDWNIESLGKAGDPFAGNLDGQGHTLHNLYIRKDGSKDQLLGYAQEGVIKNLRIVSVHPVSITGTCEKERIVGCSIIAPSTTGALAETVKGLCYFVGCTHVGNTTKPLVASLSGDVDDYFYMYGCMQVARGLSGAALSGAGSQFLQTQGEFTELKEVEWDNFTCNYFDTTLSPSAIAVTGITENYNRRQYIRGVPTNILCAKNDYLVDLKTDWKNELDAIQRQAYYGVAPWRAMNYAIQQYNKENEDVNKCSMHYVNNTVGFDYRYPVLVPNTDPGNPYQIDDSQWEDVTDKFN